MPSISTRLQEIPISAVRKLVPYATEAKKNGVKVYHLNIGDPDIETPSPMIDILKNWDIATIRYAHSSGEAVFLQAMVEYYHKLGYTSVVEADIIATIGGSEAVLMAFLALCDRNDEVLVFEPFYSNYAAIASIAGVSLKAVSTTIDDGFHLPNKETIVSAITPNTKAILFCSPGNPTGSVYTKEEMDRLVAIAKEHNLFLISDEVYREFIFDNRTHISLFSYIDEIPDHAVVLDSLSKRYALCGARLGVLVSKNKKLISGVTKIAQSRLSGGFIDQILGSQLTKVEQRYLDDIQKEYQKRRDVLYEGLMKIDGVSLAKPEGAFYSMVHLPVEDAEDFAIFLLKEFRSNNETVMLAPGNGFYQSKDKGKTEVRIAYVLNTTDLKRCIEIIKEALEAYKNQRA